jgi:hypothetical protein
MTHVTELLLLAFSAGIPAGAWIDRGARRLIRRWERACADGHEPIIHFSVLCPLCHERDAMADLEAENSKLRGRCQAPTRRQPWI